MTGDAAVFEAQRTAEFDASQDPRGATNHLRLLWIGPTEPSWIGLALRLDAQGYTETRFRWAATPATAMTILRDEPFDCILIGDSPPGASSRISNEPAHLVEALRRSGYADPVIYVASLIDDLQLARLIELDCDTLVTNESSDSPALLPLIQRSIATAERLREFHRLSVVQQRRIIRERDEAEQLLQQQQAIISKLEIPLTIDAAQPLDLEEDTDTQTHSNTSAPKPTVNLPAETAEFYQELLRTYVIMGSGSLESDIAGLAKLIVAAGVSPKQTLQFHLERVENLVRHLGNRSARHVMARADLLALEVVVQVGEEYRQRVESLD